ncbi:MAG: flagellar motor protein MotB [Pirellulaceae bacterium]
MSQEEEEAGAGIPEWVVTFGDMMSLLLTFFIMLVSLSEVKEEEKYQALVESMRKQFGYSTSQASLIPGEMHPRNSAIEKVAAMGRAKRQNLMRGGDKVQAPTGEHPRVQIVRPGSKTAIGTVIYFREGNTELTDSHKEVLNDQVKVIQGKPQKIEIRGHTSRRPVTPDAKKRDHWDLAYERCYNTMRYLVDVMKIDERRVRLAPAGSNEPVHIGTDQTRMSENPRVEIYLLDEVVSDLAGTNEERKRRFFDGPVTP